MIIEDYFDYVKTIIQKNIGVLSWHISYDKRTMYIGFIRGTISFYNGSILHLREFINVQHQIERYMYVYQYQTSDGKMIFRYDNTPHFPNLKTYPNHKHVEEEPNVKESEIQDINTVLNEIQQYL